MASSPALLPQPSSSRVTSIDALRGLTILVMIFVNDIAGVAGCPWWMEHFHGTLPDGSADWHADGMTFVDVVFPAFLFIVGMSIPFAIGRRLERGEPVWSVWRHVAMRTLGLLVAGVWKVNAEVGNNEAVLGWPPILWEWLVYLTIIVTWIDPPRERGVGRSLAITSRLIGVGLLLFLMFTYRSPDGVAPDAGWWGRHVQMHTSWWGILGLIGWAYLVACTSYTLLRKNMAGMVGAVALLYALFIADRGGLFWRHETLALDPAGNVFSWAYALILHGVYRLDQWVDFGSMLGSHAAISCSGVVMGMMLMPGSPVQGHTARVRWGALYGLALFMAGYFTYQARDVHAMFTVVKNDATMPWCLFSSAITVWIWVILYLLMDVRGWTGIGKGVLVPAGQAPLMAYVLHPFFILLFAMIGPFITVASGARPDWYAWLGMDFGHGFWLGPGFYRSVAMAVFVCWLAGWMMKRGLRLRL